MNRNQLRQHRFQEPLPWWIGIAALLLALVVGCVWWLMQVKHPEVTSPESLTLVRAIYTACSSQNSQRLDRVEREITRVRQAGKLTQAELESFQAIIAQARAGEWDAAVRESYRFAEAQVR